MPDIPTISALLSSVSSVTKLTKAFVGLKVDAEIGHRIIEIQNSILAVQAAAMDAQKQLSDLQAENARLNERLRHSEAQKAALENYTLVEAGEGKLLYQSKSVSPAHFACTKCMNQGSVSILQPQDKRRYLHCDVCGAGYRVQKEDPPQRQMISRGFFR